MQSQGTASTQKAVWGKNPSRVGSAVHRVRERLPGPLVGLDSDNGSEFIDRHLVAWCQRHHITFTRSRPLEEDDRAHVEQKNGAIVRHLIGDDRFVSQAALAQLQRVYQLVGLHVNFFQPVPKLATKTRQGARAHRGYNRAQTPYQRLAAAGVLAAAKRDEVDRLSQTLNPLRLWRDLDVALERLWPLAAPDAHRAQGERDSHSLPEVLSRRREGDGSGNPEL